MSLLTIVVAFLAALVAAVTGEVTCPCNDSPPVDDFGTALFTCEEQVGFDQCAADWMNGYCQCACKVCQYEEVDTPMESTMPVETTQPAPVEAPVAGPAVEENGGDVEEPKKEKKKKDKKAKKNRKVNEDEQTEG